MKNVRANKFVIVELSLSTSIMVEKIARGPLKIVNTAAWGRYAKMNMAVVTLTPVVMVGTSLAISGRHNSRCVAKNSMPYRRQQEDYVACREACLEWVEIGAALERLGCESLDTLCIFFRYFFDSLVHSDDTCSIIFY